MSKLDTIFGSGMEMFDDVSVEDTVSNPLAAADVAAAQELLVEAQERLAVAVEDRAIVTAERGVVEATVDFDSLRDRITTVEVVQGSMESLVGAGISRKAAGMVMDNYHRCMTSLGKTGTSFSSGTEALDDEAEFARMMDAGLEELEGEKKGLFARLGASIKNTFESVSNAITKFSDKAVRVKSNAAELKKTAAGKPATEVKLKNKQLLVKGGGASTDLSKDFTAFTKMVELTLDTMLKNGTKFISSDMAGYLNTIGNAKTLKECTNALAKMTMPKVPGVSIKQKSEKNFTITRSEVELGGWAIFVTEGTESGPGSTLETAIKFIDDSEWLDVRLAQAPFDGAGDKEFVATLDGAAAVALATSVEKLADDIIAARKTHFKAFNDAYNGAWDRYSKAGGDPSVKGNTNGEVEDGVAKIQNVALRIPFNILAAYLSVPGTSCKAALSVGDAVLDVVAKVAKAKTASTEE